MDWLKRLFRDNWGKTLVAALVGAALTFTGLPAAVIGTIATSAGDAADSAVDGYGEEAAEESDAGE